MNGRDGAESLEKPRWLELIWQWRNSRDLQRAAPINQLKTDQHTNMKKPSKARQRGLQAMTTNRHTHTHTYTHTYTHRDTHIYTHTYTHIYTHIHTHIQTHIHTHENSAYPTSQIGKSCFSVEIRLILKTLAPVLNNQLWIEHYSNRRNLKNRTWKDQALSNNLTASQGEKKNPQEYFQWYKLPSIKQGKIPNVWHPTKTYQACQQVEKYNPRWGNNQLKLTQNWHK